jgi:beta-phosphoglucomutase-like phosphatase (HAD superfamily)
MSLPVVDPTRAGTLLRINPPRSAKRNVALVVTDLIHGALAARRAGMALAAAASGEEHHHASHGGDENLTGGRDLSAD